MVGWGHYGESWGIKKGIIMGDPNDDEVWLRLDDVVEHVYKFESGRGLTVSLTFVDSGGHKTQSVYKQCRARMGKRVFAIKGKGGEGEPYTKPPSKVKIVVNGRAIGETWLYTIGVDAGKADILKGSLLVLEPGPKYCHFPNHPEAGYDYRYFTGLMSEVQEEALERGRKRTVWKVLKGHERNEPLDCRNYAMAAFRVLDPDMDAVERRLKGAPEQKAAQPQRTRLEEEKMASKTVIKSRLEFRRKALEQAQSAYLALLSGQVKSYAVGSRNLTRLDLPQLEETIAKLEKEIDGLEEELRGGKRRKAVGAIPRDW